MTEEQQKPVDKIVLTFGETIATIGINAPGCDPHFTVVGLDRSEDASTPLEQVLDQLPAAFHQARERWEVQSRNPAYHRPAPAIQPAAGRTGRQTPARPNGPTQQPLI